MPASTTVIRRACARSMICDRLRCSCVDRQAAQAVVAAERDDQHAHVALERPVEPLQAARRRVAGDAGVDDLEVQPVFFETLLRSAGYAAVGRKPEAGGQAVAEHDDARARGRDGGGRRGGSCGGAAAARASSRSSPRGDPQASAQAASIAASQILMLLCYVDTSGRRSRFEADRRRLRRLRSARAAARARRSPAASIRWCASRARTLRDPPAPARAPAASSGAATASRAPPPSSLPRATACARLRPAETRRPCSRILSPYHSCRPTLTLKTLTVFYRDAQRARPADALAGARRSRQACPPQTARCTSHLVRSRTIWLERPTRRRARPQRLWRRDPSVWSGDPAVQKAIADRLGWLTLARC